MVRTSAANFMRKLHRKRVSVLRDSFLLPGFSTSVKTDLLQLKSAADAAHGAEKEALNAQFQNRFNFYLTSHNISKKDIKLQNLHDKRAELGARIGRMNLLIERAVGARKAKLQSTLVAISAIRNQVEQEYLTLLRSD